LVTYNLRVLKFEPVFLTKRRHIDFGRLVGSLCRM
jgi:hypothetical protein